MDKSKKLNNAAYAYSSVIIGLNEIYIRLFATETPLNNHISREQMLQIFECLLGSLLELLLDFNLR